MQTCPPNMVSIYVVGKLTQIYFCKGTPWQYFSTYRGEKYCHIWRRIRIILRCVLLIGHLWREIAKWAFLWGAGGQNSLSELWTNTSLSPNLVIHSPVASLSLFCQMLQNRYSLSLNLYSISNAGWKQTKNKYDILVGERGGGLSQMSKESLVDGCKKNFTDIFCFIEIISFHPTPLSQVYNIQLKFLEIFEMILNVDLKVWPKSRP